MWMFLILTSDVAVTIGLITDLIIMLKAVYLHGDEN